MYQVYDVHFQFYFFIVSNMMDVKKDMNKYKHIICKLAKECFWVSKMGTLVTQNQKETCVCVSVTSKAEKSKILMK